MRKRGRRKPGFESLETRRLLDGSMPGTNPVLMAEHEAVMKLVPEESATIRSISDGNWSDPKIWDIGRVPLAGDNVLISEHTGVRVDSVQPAALHTIRVDGTLRFATDQNSGLSVDTIVVTSDGIFEMGTSEAPIAPNVQATVTFVGAGPIDTSWDPKQFSRGLVSQGEFHVQGAETTAFLPLARTPRKGDTTLLLSQAPQNWRVGQQLLLTGTNAYANEDEILEIKGISGTTVTVQPLKFDHATPLNSLTPYVANMSRNAVFQSADPSQIQLRGHIMIMHSPAASVAYAGLYGLGRQDKSIAVNDPVLDSAGKLVPGTGTNPRGRYALHVHRTGLDGGEPVEVRGSVVSGSPGWGFVNHSSNVDFEDNVAFNVAGAGFASEAGDEIGSFSHNLAVRSTGTNAGMEIRQGLEDFGHQGVGFWLQGGGMKVTNNVAAGQRQSGFFFMAQGLIQAGLGTTTFPAGNLPDPSWAQGRPTIEVKSVPMREFSGNEAFASGSGLDWWFSLQSATHPGRSVIDRMTIWNTRNAGGAGNGRGMILAYSSHVTVRDSLIVGDPARPFGIGVETNALASDMNFENLRVLGWNTGLKAPRNGQVNIRGGEYNNVTNIDVRPANNSRRDVNINGPFQFGTLSAGALAGRPQLDIALISEFDGSVSDISRMFDTRMVVNYDGRPLYFAEQAANFVPLKPGVASPGAPPPARGQDQPAALG